jgi:hypothetical protein
MILLGEGFGLATRTDPRMMVMEVILPDSLLYPEANTESLKVFRIQNKYLLIAVN